MSRRSRVASIGLVPLGAVFTPRVSRPSATEPNRAQSCPHPGSAEVTLPEAEPKPLRMKIVSAVIAQSQRVTALALSGSPRPHPRSTEQKIAHDETHPGRVSPSLPDLVVLDPPLAYQCLNPCYFRTTSGPHTPREPCDSRATACSPPWPTGTARMKGMVFDACL